LPRPLKRYPYTEQKGNGLWRYDKIHRAGGKKFRLQSRARYRTSLDAHNACLDTMKALDACNGDLSRLFPQAPPTFADLAEEWRSTVVPATLAHSTAQDYNRILDGHVMPVFGERPADQITRGDVKTFLLGKAADGLSASTVIHIKSVISGVLNLAVDREIINTNPAHRLGKLVSKEQREKVDIEPFTEEEVQKILAAFREKRPRDLPFIAFLACTGCRAGEAIALTWDNVDLDSGRANIQWSRTRGKTTRPKNGKPRTVELSASLVELLKVHRTQMKKEALAKGRAVPEMVFSTTAGTYLDITHVRPRAWIPMLKEAGVAYRKMHTLRHTYATQRVSAGDNVADVSQQLGHHSVQFTLDRYYHWMPSDAGREQVDRLGAALLGG
jgi:integrase